MMIFFLKGERVFQETLKALPGGAAPRGWPCTEQGPGTGHAGLAQPGLRLVLVPPVRQKERRRSTLV